MKTIESNNVVRTLTTAIAALACSTALLFTTVAPAHASDARTDAAKWNARVTAQLNQRIRAAQAVPPALRDRPATVMAVEFDRDGRHITTRLAKSSGHDKIDREAVRIVTTMRFPELPASLHGRSRLVPVEVFFGNPDINPHAIAVRTASKAIVAAHRTHAVPVGQSQD